MSHLYILWRTITTCKHLANKNCYYSQTMLTTSIIIAFFCMFQSSYSIASDILSAEYSTKFPTGVEKRFKSFDELSSYLNNPSRYVKLVRDEFETEQQYNARVSTFQRVSKEPKRFTIHFNPSLGQYSHERKSFPVLISFFKGERKSASWNSINREKNSRIVTHYYNKTAGPCLISNWWRRSPFEIVISKDPKRAWRWSIEENGNDIQPAKLQLLTSDINEAKYIREHENQLKARMECILQSAKWEEESKVYVEETGRWSSYRKEGIEDEVSRCKVRYKLYTMEVESCIVELEDKSFQIIPPDHNSPFASLIFYRNGDMKFVDKEIKNRKPSITITGSIDSDNIKSILIPRTTKKITDTDGEAHVITFWEELTKRSMEYIPDRKKPRRLIGTSKIIFCMECNGIVEKVPHEQFRYILDRSYIPQGSYDDEINELNILKDSFGLKFGSIQAKVSRKGDIIYIFLYTVSGDDTFSGAPVLLNPENTLTHIPGNKRCEINRRSTNKEGPRSIDPIY